MKTVCLVSKITRSHVYSIMDIYVQCMCTLCMFTAYWISASFLIIEKKIRSNRMTGIVTFMYTQNITPNFYFDRYFNENIIFLFKEWNIMDLYLFLYISNPFGWISLSVCTVVFPYEWLALYLRIIIIIKRAYNNIDIVCRNKYIFFLNKFIRISYIMNVNEQQTKCLYNKKNLLTKNIYNFAMRNGYTLLMYVYS